MWIRVFTAEEESDGHVIEFEEEGADSGELLDVQSSVVSGQGQKV